jgi:hypothetical protein
MTITASRRGSPGASLIEQPFMKILSQVRKSHGLALLATMCALAVMLLIFVGVMCWISSNGKQLRGNQTFMSSQAAAEGATEMVFAQMDRDYLFGSLNSDVSGYETLYPLSSNWPVQYTFRVNVTEGQQSATLQYLNNQYTNLLGEPQTVTITATATPSGPFEAVPATVSQNITFAEVPVFQFAIFYNLDLDISPGSSMSVNGSTFCNENIWCYPPAKITFNGSVEAAGNYFFHWDTNGEQSGNISSSPTKPTFNDGVALSHVDPLVLPIGAGANSSSTTNNSSVVEAIINIPPASVAAPQQIAYVATNQVYLFNEASLIVSNAAFGLNGMAPWSNPFTVYLQDSALTPSTPFGDHWIQLTNDFYIISNRNSSGGGLVSTPVDWIPNFRFTNNMCGFAWVNTAAATNGPGPLGTNSVWYAGFSFLTNVTYYDYRELDSNETVQLDVASLGAWITNCAPNGGSNWNQLLANDTGWGIDSIFIYNDAPFTSQSLPSVSVINGALLPNSTCMSSGTNVFTRGLTVATPQPLYVIGDYNVRTNGGPQVTGLGNTVNTYPAAFMADAITILSTNWLTDWKQGTYTSRSAANTTVNAACLEGIVPSTGGQKNGGDGNGAHYSGGIENFLRLLENWSGKTLTYNGSIMVMFPSEYATNYWQQPGAYYGVPNRNWGFDTNFLVQSDLPPLTPNFRTVIRNSWTGN